jgi:hypothetical protein
MYLQKLINYKYNFPQYSHGTSLGTIYGFGSLGFTAVNLWFILFIKTTKPFHLIETALAICDKA